MVELEDAFVEVNDLDDDEDGLEVEAIFDAVGMSLIGKLHVEEVECEDDVDFADEAIETAFS